MDEQDINEIEYRKAQERFQHMVNGGFHKEIAKLAKVMFDAYIEQGFTKAEALELIKIIITPPRT